MAQQSYTSILKFNIDGRPFMKDIHDLFGALIVQVPLSVNRYLFKNYHHTFTSDDTVAALGSLRFSHSVRVHDPADESKVQVRTVTTTFNMARDMAKALCQQFLWSRLLESAVEPSNRNFRDKGIWRLTCKGLCIFQEFCIRTGVDLAPFSGHFESVPSTQVIFLDRSEDDDQIHFNRSKLSVLFRVMVTSLPLESESITPRSVNALLSANFGAKASRHPPSPPTSTCNSVFSIELLRDPQLNLVNNWMLTASFPEVLPTNSETGTRMRAIFPSQLCCDWLLEYCSIASRDEAELLAREFLRHGWIDYLEGAKSGTDFLSTSKTTLFIITKAGKKIVTDQLAAAAAAETAMCDRDMMPPSPISTASVISSDSGSRPLSVCNDGPDGIDQFGKRRASHHSQADSLLSTPSAKEISHVDGKECNSYRLKTILDNPQLRSLFKDFLRTNFCEENLDFWIDYTNLRHKCRNQSPAMPSQNQRSLLEDAYDIWTRYLAPKAPFELNVEHSMRQEMDRLVSSVITVVQTYSPGQMSPTIVISPLSSSSQSLRMMLKWFDRVNEHICRLMASDSVPKFVKTQQYRDLCEEGKVKRPMFNKRDSGMAEFKEDDEEDYYSASISEIESPMTPCSLEQA
ncbi:regulator of G protein signaling domain-containing protein [Radiomyces spectabilis]|uniref:regulator of G protein signaling domain-containing protein n=1 Tax=Radiomyces spectabilis TaxID=64574 RepID=UPI00222061C1|nr:regulator of G protein signaling domain-containing protein [Radiomyces spectabilis]KAI8393622.1 regulator of G protein signaling domain-containing protein [Radiomyces spectabilis]